MDERDFTTLSVGARLQDGRVIQKCPICGRNGVVFATEAFVSAEHSRFEIYTTAAGEQRGKHTLPRARCFRRNQPE
jgi:hypothetical protein